MYPLFLLIIAIVASFLHFFISKKAHSGRRVVELILAYMLPLNIGLTCLLGFIGHIFYGPQIARLIGWPAHNPFQWEVGAANLAMAVLGFLCIGFRRGFWLATALGAGIFFLGAAWVHFIEVAKGNYAPYNSGVFLYVGDVFIPLIYLILVFIYSWQNRLFRDR